MAKIICDKCMKAIDVGKACRERNYNDGVVERYIKCDKCGAEYTALFIDDYVREKIKEISDLRTSGNINDLSERLKKSARLSEDARAHSRELEKKYKGVKQC